MTERPAKLFELRSDSTAIDITLTTFKRFSSIIKIDNMEAITSSYYCDSVDRADANRYRQVPRSSGVS
jgi:hypothetical protein